MKLRISSRATLAGALLISPLATGADLSASMSVGHPDLKSIGPIAFGPEGNLTPMLYIFVPVPLTYACSFLVVPLLSGWLDRLR